MKSLEQHAAQLGALGHPARLAILRYVVQAGPNGVTTTDLQEKLKVPWTTLNHHLDRLVSNGLITARREGRLALHTADFAALKALTDFLWKDCCNRGRRSAGDCC
jgi:ArsR family transcriptional regulator, arsenate/arsenite/antimonite-responsive transcriptional repressor